MATAGQWLGGARPRTLPAAVAPVAVGSGVAAYYAAFRPLPAALALALAVALQVGVNYANDYSDGIKGTDHSRVGPVRLVGQGLAPARAVRSAAIGAFGLAGALGLALVALSGIWWLLLVGVACIAAGWLYTGGPRPYGYAGLGELFVFVFFGLVATGGTALTQIGWLPGLAVVAAVPPGLWCCAILMANNLRDIPGDEQVGKMTLEVRLGDRRSRWLYTGTMVVAFLTIAALAAWTWWSLLAWVSVPLAARPISNVLSGAKGRDLIPVLSGTSAVLLAGGILLGVGLAL